MSAESGIATFRDQGGLWEQYPIEEVATPEAWEKDVKKVLNFYNMRRKQLLSCSPHPGHMLIAELEQYYEVQVITQNIDDLHERAGSSHILHLHGELRKARSTGPSHKVYPIEGWALDEGDVCEDGFQLRPHVVWFGEEVPAMVEAFNLLETADHFITIGTSLSVYPAASLVHAVPQKATKCLIDPNPEIRVPDDFIFINQNAAEGLKSWMLHNQAI